MTARTTVLIAALGLGCSGCMDSDNMQVAHIGDPIEPIIYTCDPGACGVEQLQAELERIRSGDLQPHDPSQIMCRSVSDSDDAFTQGTKCTECASSDDCPDFFICIRETVCLPPEHSCASDADCADKPSSGPLFCHQPSGYCIMCLDDARCNDVMCVDPSGCDDVAFCNRGMCQFRDPFG